MRSNQDRTIEGGNAENRTDRLPLDEADGRASSRDGIQINGLIEAGPSECRAKIEDLD